MLSLLINCTATSRNVCFGCKLSTITHAMKQSPAFPCPETCYLLRWIPRCSPSCLLATSLTFSSAACSWKPFLVLVLCRTSDPLSIALRANETYQSQVFSISTVNHVTCAGGLGDECPVLAFCFPPASRSRGKHSLSPGPPPCCPPALSSPSCHSNSPFVCCYHHADQAQKCTAPYSWSGNLFLFVFQAICYI